MPRPRAPSFETKLALVFFAGLLVLLGTIAYGMRLAGLAAGADTQRDATSLRLRTLNLTLSAMQDAETGQRGFLITGRPEYLEPFELALGRLDRLFPELRRLYRGHPAERERIESMGRLRDAKLAELRRTIELRRRDAQAATAAVLGGEGKAHMDAFRAETRALLEAERERHAALSRQAQQHRIESRLAYGLVFLGTALAGLAAWLLLVRELHERRRLRERLSHEASHDPLTRLPNARFFHDWLRHSVVQARREKGRLGLLLLNLDGLGRINERFGTDAGDRVLELAAERFRETVRDSDFLARLDGDEFAVLTPLSSAVADAARLADRLIGALDLPLMPQLREHPVSASVGIAFFPQDAAGEAALLEAAAQALHEAKQGGRHRHRRYRAEPGDADDRAARLHADLPGALERGELVLHYQPQVEAVTGRLVAAEVLLRWRHPALGLVGPQEFVPMAEESGLIQMLGAWVVRHACAQAAQWRRELSPRLRLSINVSALQLEYGDFPALLARQLALHRLPAEALEVELTEGLLARPQSADSVARLKAMGVRIAVDDFGTGYAALGYLKRFALDHVKIDRSFVSGLPADQADAAIVRAIASMGRHLGLSLVAEGVETAAQADFLRELHCDYFQGYLYGKPMSAEEFAQRCGSGSAAA